MAKKGKDNGSNPDDENPEWTRDDIREARPALKVCAELFGIEATETLKRAQPAKP